MTVTQLLASPSYLPVGMSPATRNRPSPGLPQKYGRCSSTPLQLPNNVKLNGIGFSRFVVECPHGCSSSKLPALARDVPPSASTSTGQSPAVPGPELIVLGLSPEALVTATPVGGSSSAASYPADTAGSYGSDSQLPVLVDAQALLASSQASHDAARSNSEIREIWDASSSGQDAAVRRDQVQPDSLVASATTSAATSSGKTAATDGTLLPAASTAPDVSTTHTQPQAQNATQTPQQNQPVPQLQQEQQQQQQQPGLWERITGTLRGVHWGKLWALTLLSISYIHQATTGFALPAMLPMISNELHLTDLQGALLTTGYSYLYAVALVPIGLLADRMSRPKLLATGLALWSVLTCTASTCRSFGTLILARVGFAAAQGAQNPVCFSLIPELFPVNKSTALSVYNCAIYVGRALSFAAVLLARHLHDNDQVHLAARGGVRVQTRLGHLDRADLHSLSIMHTAGDMAAATPDREFNFPLWEYGSDLPDAAWRQVLRWIALPGFLISIAMLATLQEPRQAAAAAASASQQPPAPAAEPVAPAQRLPDSSSINTKPRLAVAAAPPLTGAPVEAAAAPAAGADTASSASHRVEATSAAARNENAPTTPATTTSTTTTTTTSGTESSNSSTNPSNPSTNTSGIMALLRSPGFMSVTLAAALNDVGSYALIAWQSTFYERVYGLQSSAYAPVLATLLPIGGILGGVGGGYLADRLSRGGRRWWVTAGATCLAAPCLAASCLAPTPEASYAALVVGFALSEMWRAPSAVMARGLAPASMGSSASALYLCVRNLLGGLGPLAVAALAGSCGLQRAMLVAPAMYLASGLLFAKAEKLYEAEMGAKVKAAAA